MHPSASRRTKSSQPWDEALGQKLVMNSQINSDKRVIM